MKDEIWVVIKTKTGQLKWLGTVWCTIMVNYFVKGYQLVFRIGMQY